MSKIIECENITHYYGNRLIYENLSFDVEQGKVLGLLGKNGTGKTTIINILNGYLKPRSGVCRLFGEEMEHLSPLTKSKVGLLLEGHVQHAYFTVSQIEKFYSVFFPKCQPSGRTASSGIQKDPALFAAFQHCCEIDAAIRIFRPPQRIRFSFFHSDLFCFFHVPVPAF